MDFGEAIAIILSTSAWVFVVLQLRRIRTFVSQKMETQRTLVSKLHEETNGRLAEHIQSRAHGG